VFASIAGLCLPCSWHPFHAQILPCACAKRVRARSRTDRPLRVSCRRRRCEFVCCGHPWRAPDGRRRSAAGR
jgi:hypothetical protein